MEEPISTTESENSESLPLYELLILHTSEAQEWATYLQQILKSSRKFPKRSILLYTVSSADQLHGYNFECFQRCKCIVLLLSGVFFDILYDHNHELQGALQRLLYPPHRVVVLLCGVSEEDILTESFQDWPIWRKLYADDEPALYVSTILESIAESRRVEAEYKREAAEAAAEAAAAEAAAAEAAAAAAEAAAVAAAEAAEAAAAAEAAEAAEAAAAAEAAEAAEAAAAAEAAEAAEAPAFHIPEVASEYPTTDEAEEGVSEEQKETVLEYEEPASTLNSTHGEMSSPTHISCLTVQPNRVLCGEQETLYIIFTHKVDEQSAPEVEFSCDNAAVKRVQSTVENEYTISVIAPDMPAGMVSLTMLTNQSSVSLSPVTYYTSMGEISRCLENAADPVNFLCQAFNLTFNATESLDDLLTDSFKSRMPANSLQLFGIKQIEKENMSTYQRNEDLPTLLHFAARYGLKKLTDVLLQCPGALQAYSVMNKDGDYPNTLAEKSGYTDLRQYIDEVVLSPETADVVETPLENTISTEDTAEIYEAMSASQDMIMKYTDCPEDIYESMLEIDPECAEDLYEEMTAVDENREEAMLRKFFQAKPRENNVPQPPQWKSDEEEEVDHETFEEIEEEEDPYNICPEDIYDTVDENNTYNPAILNRPPAPIPRPENKAESEKSTTYISRVFSDKGETENRRVGSEYLAARPVIEAPVPAYDPYAGMKTPGQRQLISLQERVKVGEITVDEAVQEFKAWQFDHERRASSIRFQQENLKKLRDSISRRHKERDKTGKELGCEISAPLQRNLYWGTTMTLECAVYEPAPRVVAPPPPATQMIQRGGWKTGSTSSTSSTESNRLSTHSNISLSSGTEPDFEDSLDNPPPPPRPPRPSEPAPHVPPPRIPPRIPERVPEMVHERYISCPTRALPQRPSYRQTASAPPLPRRTR